MSTSAAPNLDDKEKKFLEVEHEDIEDEDHPKEWKAAQDRLLKRISPESIIPPPGAVVVLILGCKNQQEHFCDFQIPFLLLLQGLAAVAIYSVAMTFRYMIDSLGFAITDYDKMPRFQKISIFIIRIIGLAGLALEFALTVAFSVELIKMASIWQSDDKEAPNYCEYGLVFFSISVVTINWLFFAFTGISYFFIVFLELYKEYATDFKLLVSTLFTPV